MALSEMDFVNLKQNVWDNWPDLSDGESIIAYSNRIIISDQSKAKAKKIGTDVYIQLEAKFNNLNTSSSAGKNDIWKLTDTISCLPASMDGLNIDTWQNFDLVMTSTQVLRCLCITSEKSIYVAVYGSRTYNEDFKFYAVIHGVT